MVFQTPKEFSKDDELRRIPPAPSSPVTIVDGARLGSFSLTVESPIIMPRRSPRIELVQALQRGRYLESLELEISNATMLLQKTLILLKMSRPRHSLSIVAAKHGIRLKKRRPIFGTLSKAALLEYLSYSKAMNERMSIVATLLSERYVSTRVPLPKSCSWLFKVLPRSPDDIFEYHTRMTRRSFGMVLHVLENEASSFFQSSRGRKQLPVAIQLHLALFCLGYYGNGASFESARQKFGFSVGTVHSSRRRIVNALVSLTSKYIKWPNAAQRRNLCRKAKMKYGYHSAFFLVDGTTHPFAFDPSYEKSSWFDRKHRYSMQALVTCDAFLNVIHLVVGWPGSAHDARVLGSAEFMRLEDEHEYFTGDQHGLGDAAFGLHRRVVPNYKNPLARLPENREYNMVHSSFRVRSEHTIGVVKNRFQALKEVRLRLRNKKEVGEIVKFITAGYVLHNMLQTFKDELASVYDVSEMQQNDALDLEDIESAPLPENLEVVSTGAAFREKVKEQVLQHIGYD